VGIKDVARVAGVSITTVSHALSGKGRLPEHTRERIRRIAEELGYSPHPAARSLASGRTGLIATVVSVPGGVPLAFTEIDYYVALVNGATGAAIERGYALVLAPSTAGAETWGRLPLDGVIVIDPAEGDPTIPHLRARGLPIVFVGRDPSGRPEDLVVQNDRAAATTTVLEHLVEVGGRRIAFASLRSQESFTPDCLAAYEAWCAARALEPIVELAPIGPTASAAAFRAAAEAFLGRDARPPDAVFCLYERLAVALLEAARARRLRIPEDLRVATIAELGLAERTTPPLTTLEIHQGELGRRAVQVLADVLAGAPGRSVLDVPTSLVVRGSTAGGRWRRGGRDA
jgi:DNA-binding LacI/PurR family transcriptional regulator